MAPQIAALLLAVAPLSLTAQLMVSRNFSPIILTDSAATGFLTRTAFVGEVQRGFGSREDEWAWDLKLAGVLYLFRWQRSALVATAAHELTANPFNSIGFNPRGAIWEETLSFVQRTRGLHWQIGLFHRCRHEIDNSHPPDESEIDPTYEPTARLLSLTGARAGITSAEITAAGASARAFLEVERYATTTDNRTPRNTAAPFWKRALGSGRIGATIKRRLAASHAVYGQGWSTLMLFSRGPDRAGAAGYLHWRTEAGLRLSGAAQQGVDLFAAYERTFDDVTRPVPQRSGVLGVGVRFEPR